MNAGHVETVPEVSPTASTAKQPKQLPKKFPSLAKALLNKLTTVFVEQKTTTATVVRAKSVHT